MKPPIPTCWPNGSGSPPPISPLSALILGSAARFAKPIRGAYLAVSDPENGVAAIRDILLTPPFTRRARFSLHVTLLHPNQGERLEEAWPEFSALRDLGSFEVVELQLIGTSDETLMSAKLTTGIPLTQS